MYETVKYRFPAELEKPDGIWRVFDDACQKTWQQSFEDVHHWIETGEFKPTIDYINPVELTEEERQQINRRNEVTAQRPG